jgi:hypothetical protein
MMPQNSTKLLELSKRVDRLDPHKFFEERDEIVFELTKLATGYDDAKGDGLE